MNRVSRKKNDNFTIISNVFLRDKELSIKAKGFLAVVMGLPDSWEFTINGICQVLKEGKTSIYNVINELKEKGYCKTEICRSDKGVILGMDYSFFEEPSIDKPNTDYPHTENPSMDNQPQLNTYVSNDLKDEILNKKEDTNVSKKAKTNWRADIEVYRDACEKAKNVLADDKEFEKLFLSQFPNADYYRSIMKSLVYWKSEKGWECKKKSRSTDINMVMTLKKNLDKSIVYKNAQDKPIQNERLLHIRMIDDEGTLVDGTIFKEGHRYYYSQKDKANYSIPVDAIERPDDRYEWDNKKGWYLPENKICLEDELW